MPESWRSCGERKAPAARMTSRRASAVTSRPSCRYTTPARAAAVERHLHRLRVHLDREIRSLARGPQVSDRRGAPEAAPCGELVIPGAFLARAVEIVVARNVELRAAGDDGLDQLMPRGDVRCPERAVGPMPLVGPPHVVLELAEIGQHIAEGPSGIAARRPLVVVLGLAADVDEAVYGARTAQRLAAGPVDLPAIHVRLGLGLEAPVHVRIEHRLRVPDGDVDPRVAIRRSRLEEQDRMAPVGAQPVGEHATGRAGTDDDVVEGRDGHVAGDRFAAASRAGVYRKCPRPAARDVGGAVRVKSVAAAPPRDLALLSL